MCADAQPRAYMAVTLFHKSTYDVREQLDGDRMMHDWPESCVRVQLTCLKQRASSLCMPWRVRRIHMATAWFWMQATHLVDERVERVCRLRVI